jgi:thiol-disulfide isomerase/thioredoxin
MNRRHFITQATTALATLSSTSLLSAADWKEGQPMPDLSKYGLTGALPKTEGKVVYLDFWASWCTPCRSSFPVLSGWYEELKSKGLLIIGVSVDEDAVDMQEALKKTPASFPTLHDAQQKLVAAANVDTMPTSFIIDKKGIIRHVHTGFKSKDATELHQQIQALL